MNRSAVRLGPVATHDHPLLVPVVSLVYAVGIAAALFAADQLVAFVPGAWFEVLGAAVLILCVITIVVLLRAAVRRRREGLRRRAFAWAGSAAIPALLAALAIFSLVESAQNASVISGADTHLTKPLIESLPRPPGSRLLDERPGLAGTETIDQDFSATDAKGVVSFYEAKLTKDGWVEDRASATTSIVRFTRGAFVLALEINPASGTYTLTIDHVNLDLLQSPTPTSS